MESLIYLPNFSVCTVLCTWITLEVLTWAVAYILMGLTKCLNNYFSFSISHCTVTNGPLLLVVLSFMVFTNCMKFSFKSCILKKYMNTTSPLQASEYVDGSTYYCNFNDVNWYHHMLGFLGPMGGLCFLHCGIHPVTLWLPSTASSISSFFFIK